MKVQVLSLFKAYKERKKLAGEAYEKAKSEEAEKSKALEAEILEQGEKLKKAQAAELGLRKQQRELGQKAEELELTVERKKIAEDAQRKAAEAGELKMREKDDMVLSLKKQLEDIDPSAGSGRGGGWSRDRRSVRAFN